VLVSPASLPPGAKSEPPRDGAEVETNREELSRWISKSSLNKLRHQLELGSQQAAGYDELSAQQNANSAAANSGAEVEIGEPGSEFEGVWHSGPLQQVEVRQLRDAGAHSAEIVRTTSSSREVFLVD